MKVLVQQGYKGEFAKVNGLLCVFDRAHAVPQVGATVEVMIKRVVFKRDANGCLMKRIRENVKLIVLRTVGPDDILIHHQGFICLGSGCSTLAEPQNRGLDYCLSPGALHSALYEADHVNLGWYKDRPVPPVIPGNAYVNKFAQPHRSQYVRRIEGVPSMGELSFVMEELNEALIEYRALDAEWQAAHDAKNNGNS